MTTVAKHDINKRHSSACYWQHLATTADVVSAINRRPTIVACWSHTSSSSVYSVMVDWTWGSVTRLRPRQLILVERWRLFILYFTMHPPHQIAPSLGGGASGAHLMRSSFGTPPTVFTIPNGMSIALAILAEWLHDNDQQTKTQTDRRTDRAIKPDVL